MTWNAILGVRRTRSPQHVVRWKLTDCLRCALQCHDGKMFASLEEVDLECERCSRLAGTISVALRPRWRVNAGECGWRRECDTVTRLNPAEWRVSNPRLSFTCGLPSF